jgi:MULE transposase domain
MKAFRSKESAALKINGSYEEGFKAVPEYCKNIESTNPGSVIELCSTSENKFQRVFICYSASASGFAHCRPLLGLDGTYLKSKYQDILLSSTGVDAKGCLFPLAYAVVDAENDENWKWFLQKLREVIQLHIPRVVLDANAITFLSDRQKGLVEGVNVVFPLSAHGYCLKHLEQNFGKKFKHPELTSLLWKAARATTELEFNTCMSNMSKSTKRLRNGSL